MERRALLLIAIFAIVLSSSSVATRGDQTVWSGIVIASNSGPPEPTPAELTPLETTLRQLFGYTRLHLIGEARKTLDRKSTRLNSSHSQISYAVFCLKKKKK